MEILLVCAAGMSTSLLVNKMKAAAKEKGIEATIEAYPVSQVAEKGATADVILLGPQVRFELNKVKGIFPEKPVEVIDMKDYGTMNGAKVLARAEELMNK